MQRHQCGRGFWSLPRIFAGVCIAALVAATAHPAEPEIVIGDFEGDDYGGWQATGEAFGDGPARGTLPGQMHVEGFLGKGLVNSFLQGDRSTGSLTSPMFKIERRYLSFLIGGGGHVGKTCLTLMVDGKPVRSITGPNTEAGGSETLQPASWDVGEYAGRSAQLVIIDAATGGWGHINVDHIVATDTKPPVLIRDARRELVATGRYLHLPVKNGAAKRNVVVKVDGAIVRAFDIELADAKPDWWAFLEIAPFAGKTLVIAVDQLRDDSQALQQIQQSDAVLDDAHYSEPLRPQFHFSAKRGWLNDPNGLVHFQGEWHLFFQHNPYGWGWGNMHWGHAVSRDLLHWEELGEALYPDEFGTMFSGSAVVDWRNTSGFQAGREPPLVLIYTAAGGAGIQSQGKPFTQCLAYSNDSGRTWTKYAGNPVLPQITGGNRDPKVFWHEPTQRWVMPLYVQRGDKHTIEFFASSNLKEWKFLSAIEGFYECPDFFELPMNGDQSQRKWVLLAASSEYMVGAFDGVTFQPETPKLPGHRGKGFYAAQTYSDAPQDRRVQFGWLQAPAPGMSFNQCLSTPLELSLRSTREGPRLRYQPVQELESLQVSQRPLTSSGPAARHDDLGELLRIDAEIRSAPAGQAQIRVRGAEIVFDAAQQELSVNGHRVAAPSVDGLQSLTILVDRTTLEIFASDGLVYMPFPFIAQPTDRSVGVTIQQGRAEVSGAVHVLRSAWPNAGAAQP
ncbi:MAG: glycoside hydrolase family 32 protein [Planctomycetaceae bacterium]|nr:glycoside hydrolase family 32 protein [Planctomycetaceae bacterium]